MRRGLDSPPARVNFGNIRGMGPFLRPDARVHQKEEGSEYILLSL
jgi:hypothetical protein